MPKAETTLEERRIALFRHGRLNFANVHALIDQEQAFAAQSLEFSGWHTCAEAHLCLVFDLMDECGRDQGSWPGSSDVFPILAVRLVGAAKAMRAALLCGTSGYPLSTLQVLRNVFDDLVLDCGVVTGLASYPEILGLSGEGGPYAPATARKRRVAVERRVVDQIWKGQSGLSASAREDLDVIDRLYDDETHGSRVSLAIDGSDWIRGLGPLEFVGEFEPRVSAAFFNRYSEVAWMHTRLLARLQPIGSRFTRELREKWSVVDASWGAQVRSLWVLNRKRIGLSIAELVETKFLFSME